MGFIEAIKSGYSRYFDFQGRSSRSEFWYWKLYVALVGVPLLIFGFFMLIHTGGLDPATFANQEKVLMIYWDNFLYFVPVFLWYLIHLIPVIALQVRRLHDRGVSGWLVAIVWLAQILLMVPALLAYPTVYMTIHIVRGIIGIALLVMFLLPGTSGDNQYGPDPLASQ